MDRNRSTTPRVQVFLQADRGLRGAEGDRLDEDPGQQEVDVGNPVRQRTADRAAEHVDEQQHEQDRLDRGEDQQVRLADEVTQVAPVTTTMSVMAARTACGRGRCGRSTGRCGAGMSGGGGRGRGRRRVRGPGAPPSSPGGAPVSCRKTSSSVGWRSPMSLTPICARRSPAAASSTKWSPSRGAGRVRRSGRSSGCGSPQPTPARTACARSRCPRWPVRPPGAAGGLGVLAGDAGVGLRRAAGPGLLWPLPWALSFRWADRYS